MSSTSSSTRTPSFSLSLHALLTFPIRICNPPPAASSVRSCKITPLIKISLDDVLNKRHLPPLTLKDFEEWLVFVEGKPQYLYFLLWLKEYESRYASWLAEYGFSYYPTTPLSSSDALSASKKSTTGASEDGSHNNNSSNKQSLAVPTASNINYIPPSTSLALFFTRAKKTFLDPTASSPSPYTLPYSALSSLILAQASSSAPAPHFDSASRPDLDNINERWKQVSKALFGPGSHPHPHPKEFAALSNHIRSVLKDSLERFAISACHNVGTRRAWCGLAGGLVIVLLFGVLPTLFALFYGHSRWVRFVGAFGCWLGGTVIFSSLHGICMMIYLFGDLRQLRSFELVKPAISNPRAIARARPRLKTLLTRNGEEKENLKQQPDQVQEKQAGDNMTVPGCNLHQNQHSHQQPLVAPQHSLPVENGLSSPPLPSAHVFPVTVVAKPMENKGGKAAPNAPTTSPGHQAVKGNNRLSTIISTPEDALSPIAKNTDKSGVPSPASSVDDFKGKLELAVDVVLPRVVPSDTNPQTFNATDFMDYGSDSSSGSSSSDHGIVVSPAYQTSVRYGHQDEWMWESVGRKRSEPQVEDDKQSQKETWNSSPRSRVMSAVGSIIHWASSARRVNSSTITTTTTSSCDNTTPRDNTRDNTNSNTSSFASPLPTAIVDRTISTPRPTSNAGTFGVRSWSGPKPISGSQYDNSSRRSIISYDVHGDQRLSARASSRWSRRFGFNFRAAVRSVPEEGVLEGPSEYVSTQCTTCPNGYDESSVDSSSHVRSVSQAQTIESFYAPPRASIFGTGALAHKSVELESGLVSMGTIPLSDQCTASFIPREYAAEVLPDLESVPRVSLSTSRPSMSGDGTGKEKENEKETKDYPRPIAAVSPVSLSRIPSHAPLFSFEGLPGLVQGKGEDVDDDENKENLPIAVDPSVPAAPPLPRAVRPRPPRLQLQNSAMSSSSTPLVHAAQTPVSPALPSSQFAYSAIGNHQGAIAFNSNNTNNTSSSPLSSPSPNATYLHFHYPLLHPPPVKAKGSKLWFDTCPRHPAVEAKIAEACAFEEQIQQRGLGLKKERSAASSTLLGAPPYTPLSFASKSSSAPSTFYSSSVAGMLPSAGSAYPYSPSSPCRKTWATKIKDAFRTIVTRSAPSPPSQMQAPPSPALLASNFFSSSSDGDSHSASSKQWRSRLKSVTSVPAFGPLTRVFEPLVSRGQWEIVVRSAAYAFLSAWIWLGVIISLPVMRTG